MGGGGGSSPNSSAASLPVPGGVASFLSETRGAADAAGAAVGSHRFEH